jgi:hypothetical protein
MQTLKRKLRSRSNPLEQIGKRIGELMKLESDSLTAIPHNDQFPQFFYPHNTGPVLPSCSRRQFRCATLF